MIENKEEDEHEISPRKEPKGHDPSNEFIAGLGL
jgi:hypothetical protein